MLKTATASNGDAFGIDTDEIQRFSYRQKYKTETLTTFPVEYEEASILVISTKGNAGCTTSLRGEIADLVYKMILES